MIQSRKGITLYHGTADRFTTPGFIDVVGVKDFGPGFYCTTDRNQAIKFAKNRSYSRRTNMAYVNQYYIETFDGLRILEFETASLEWLSFICRNRTRVPFRHGYDVVIGKIADDDTRRTLDAYMRGDYNHFAQPGQSVEQLVIRTLEPDRLKNQVCLCTPLALSRLVFVKASVVRV